jgi:hypothetical protein
MNFAATMCENRWMRRRVVFAFGVGVSLAGGFVACGLDESGQADGAADVTVGDGSADGPSDVVIDIPQACKTLDASACVDADVPDGWTLAVISPYVGACPSSTDYDPSVFLTNPVPVAGCQCTCLASGAVDCSGTLEAGSGNPTCNEGAHWFTFDAGNDAACLATNWNDPHYEVPVPPTSLANVKCTASAPNPPWDASLATTCTPKCTADFCNVGSTYKRCIIAANQATCPAPFTQKQSPLGIDSGVGTSCSGCTCGVDASAQCAAVIQPFNGTSCDTPTSDAAVTDGACNTSTVTGGGGKVFSVMYTPVVPTATCSASGGTADASFLSSITVCCLP